MRESEAAAITAPIAISEHRFTRLDYYVISPYLDPARHYELVSGTIYGSALTRGAPL